MWCNRGKSCEGGRGNEAGLGDPGSRSVLEMSLNFGSSISSSASGTGSSFAACWGERWEGKG